MADWQPIETAPKGDGETCFPRILLGFAPDEEHFSPETREGFWSHTLSRWASSLDPGWASSPQPTHWQPLPDPPKD